MNDDQRMKEQKPSDYPRHHDTPRLKHNEGCCKMLAGILISGLKNNRLDFQPNCRIIK